VRPTVPAAGTNRKLCVYGSFNHRTGQTHYLVHGRKNGRQFAEFLRQLLEANRQRHLVLVLDNASYHRTAEVLDLLTAHEDHVFVLWLPKYSPELNLIEGLTALEQAINDALAELQQHPETALSLAYGTAENLRKTA